MKGRAVTPSRRSARGRQGMKSRPALLKTKVAWERIEWEPLEGMHRSATPSLESVLLLNGRRVTVGELLEGAEMFEDEWQEEESKRRAA